MFENWKAQVSDYVLKRLDHRSFRKIEHELADDVSALDDAYLSILTENGVIDANGDDTGVDFDEDDLLEAMLDRFLAVHPCDGADELLYTSLINAYLALVEEYSEDL